MSTTIEPTAAPAASTSPLALRLGLPVMALEISAEKNREHEPYTVKLTDKARKQLSAIMSDTRIVRGTHGVNATLITQLDAADPKGVLKRRLHEPVAAALNSATGHQLSIAPVVNPSVTDLASHLKPGSVLFLGAMSPRSLDAAITPEIAQAIQNAAETQVVVLDLQQDGLWRQATNDTTQSWESVRVNSWWQ